MFKQIFSFEINSWFNKPSFYIYSAIVLAITALLIAISGGVFSGNTATVTSPRYLNSPLGILDIVGSMTLIAMLLFTNVCGDSIYKDFKTGTYQLMYSYPFSKPAYFFGKFLSAFVICLILILCIALGMLVGFSLPGMNLDMLGPHSIKSYVDTYLYYMIPNTFLFCAIVFAVVTYTRSIVAGFVAIIAIYIFSISVSVALDNQEYFKAAALADPFGTSANVFYTKYWTVDEYNNEALPIKGYVIYNRLLWLAVASLILLWSYFSFSFETVPSRWSLFRKKETKKSISHKSQQILNIDLPEVKRSFGIKQKLSSAWLLSKIDLNYVLKGGAFIVTNIIGILFIGLGLFFSDFMGTKTYPLTANMITSAGGIFTMFILILTFVYTGLIINRRVSNNIYQLEDVSATKNISFFVSKFITITLMQGVLLAIPIIVSIIYQISQGYYNFEIGVYLFDAYAISWIRLIPWTLFAILIYAIIPNFYLGLMLCFIILVGLGFLPRLGIEKSIYRFNSGSGISYSDMTGFTGGFLKYYVYRFYWLLGGTALGFLGLYFWRRGVKTSFKERIRNARLRSFRGEGLIGFCSLGAFLILGGFIYYNTFKKHESFTSKEQEQMTVDFEKKYKRLASLPQPRIIDVDLKVDLYPSTNDIDVTGYYILKNKTTTAIDSIVILDGDLLREVSFDRDAKIGFQDSTMINIRSYGLSNSLAPGDSLKMSFVLKNKENTMFRSYGPVEENSTFFSQSIFPAIGYNSDYEFSDDKIRKKYDLPPKERMPDIYDTTAYGNTYISNCSDWINFEIVIGTAIDQVAMAPGQLQRDWEENDRKYYHYKMDQKMLNFYNISSARYEVAKDKWNDVELSILHHKGHDFNIDRMMLALKDGFDYYTTEFSPYQFKQLRVLEFPFGGYAQSYANTIPFAENVGITAMVDDSDEGGVDYAYQITAHELAHQWWGHQVVGANVRGATMLSESLAEYSSFKVLEKRYGENKLRISLKGALDEYLLLRQLESSKELPLAFNENQAYIHYKKGSLIFYALSDLIGEKVLNGVLADYIKQVGFQEPPYTTSLELLSLLKAATPDSLQYFIDDSFENITLYNNRIEETEYQDNGDGTYSVDITAQVTKYRTDEKGKQSFTDENGLIDSLVIEGKKKPIKSYPLADYIDVGIFGTEEIDGKEKEKALYLQKHKITKIENKFTITVKEEPKEVGIDPYNKLIDRDSNDNRRKLEKKN